MDAQEAITGLEEDLARKEDAPTYVVAGVILDKAKKEVFFTWLKLVIDTLSKKC